jgi:hypothetical protein
VIRQVTSPLRLEKSMRISVHHLTCSLVVSALGLFGAASVGACATGAPPADEDVLAAEQEAKRPGDDIDCFPRCKKRIPLVSPKGTDNCQKLKDTLIGNNTPAWISGKPICLGTWQDIDSYIHDHMIGVNPPCNRLGLPECNGHNGAVCWSHCKNQLMMECILSGKWPTEPALPVTSAPVDPKRWVTKSEECLWNLCGKPPWKRPTARVSLVPSGGGADSASSVAVADSPAPVYQLEDAACDAPFAEALDVDEGAGFDFESGDEGATCSCSDGQCPAAPVPPEPCAPTPTATPTAVPTITTTLQIDAAP